MTTQMTTFDFKKEDFSPQLQRILAMAAVESSRDQTGRGACVQVEHVLVAMAQEGENFGCEVLVAAGLTVRDLRAGLATPPKEAA